VLSWHLKVAIVWADCSWCRSEFQAAGQRSWTFTHQI